MADVTTTVKLTPGEFDRVRRALRSHIAWLDARYKDARGDERREIGVDRLGSVTLLRSFGEEL